MAEVHVPHLDGREERGCQCHGGPGERDIAGVVLDLFKEKKLTRLIYMRLADHELAMPSGQ